VLRQLHKTAPLHSAGVFFKYFSGYESLLSNKEAEIFENAKQLRCCFDSPRKGFSEANPACFCNFQNEYCVVLTRATEDS